jgi:hypothetical protein
MAVRLQRGLVVRRLVPAALMPAGAFAVHQLRYWLAYGSRVGVELAEQGHSYLQSVVPWIVLLIGLSVGTFLVALGRALGGRPSVQRHTLSFAALWLLCAACLVAIYTTQEFLEGSLATGHPGGIAGIFGSGGWWSIPAALAVGLILAATFHGARRVLQAVAERCARRMPPARGLPEIARTRRDALLPALAPLADGWSGRGPPG